MNAKNRVRLKISCYIIILGSIIFSIFYFSFCYLVYEIAAAFIGAFPLALYILYDYWIGSPELEIIFKSDNPVRYKPQHPSPENILSQAGQAVPTTRQYLKVVVKNEGLRIAKNCEARVDVLGRPINENGIECEAPANEPKYVKWSGRNPRELQSIYPKGGEADLDVVCRDRDIEFPWHRSEQFRNLVAFIATHDVFSSGSRNRAQDGLCRGDYEIKITIFTENGKPTLRKFTLTVGEDWQHLELTPLDG